jgi:hypothetical protein
MAISDALYNRKYPDLLRYYSSDTFGHASVFGALYAISSGTGHSAQYALAAMFKAVNTKQYNFVEAVKEYGDRASIMKKRFAENGFNIVYDTDIDMPIADGFYFTLSYPGFTGAQLLEKLLFYGISAISLDITGSEHSEGLRACVSQVRLSQIDDLEKRLIAFKKDHPLS